VAAYPSSMWNPLVDEKEYKVAILDFILAGGDGYVMVQAGARYEDVAPPGTSVRFIVDLVFIYESMVIVNSFNVSE
jgi:hypothetical protein